MSARHLIAVLSLAVLGLAGSLAGAQGPAAATSGWVAVQEGAQDELPIVTRITVEGARRYTEEQLIGALGQKVGEPLAPQVVSRGVKVLFEAFHVVADVFQHPATGPDDPPGSIELLLRVRELPLDLEPRFVGNVRVDKEELYEWAGLEKGAELYLYQAPRVRDRLQQRYLREGYYFAEVRVVERPEGVDPETGERIAPDVIFEIREGPKVKVRDVVLHGNDSISNDSIPFLKRGLSKLAQVELRGPRIFGLFSKDFVRETLDADIVALREVYRDYGYLDAVVGLDRLEFSSDRSRVTIHIAIDEGEPYRVGSISIEAYERFEDPANPGRLDIRPAELVFPEKELLDLLELEEGMIYEKKYREADLRALRTYYGERGYVDHPSLPPEDRLEVLDVGLSFEADEPVVHVTYRIAQGLPQFIREILISGNLHTQDRVIRRLVSVEPGDSADPIEIERSRNRIQGTGYFSDQRDIAHREPTFRFVETDDRSWKDLEFILEEGQDLNFSVSGGISSNTGLFGLITLSKRNFDVGALPRSPLTVVEDIANRDAFAGAGQELRIRASPGTEVSFFDVYFLEPDILRRHKQRISLALSAAERLRIYRSHDERRSEYGFELGRQIGEDSSVYGGFTFGDVEIDDISGGGEPVIGDPLSVPGALKRQEGTNDLNFIDAGYRYSTLDSRFNPKNGVSVNFSNQFSDSAVGSDFDFTKSDLRLNFYDELGIEDGNARNRYHLELRGGIAFPYGDSDEVPYSERFFLGGQVTLRGFDYRGVGPNEKDFPIGGETYLYSSLEFLRPLVTTTQPGTYEEIETVYGGLFLDTGVLGPDAGTIDPDEVRMSAGILFGIAVPLPILFSFGFPIIQGDGDRTQVLGFNIGF